MNKIRIIELLNKIANGEEVPKKIIDNNNEYVFNQKSKRYELKDEPWCYLNFATDALDEEFEIIEEQEEIDIIRGWGLATDYKDFETINHTLDRFGNKINELVQAVKQLDTKIKEK